ncbi:MAG: leucine-rich repeat protein [Lysinibacillus sp.]
MEINSSELHYGFGMNESGIFYFGDEPHIIVPAMFNGRPVTTLAHEGFANKDILSVQLPNTITEIGSSAFKNCTLLEYVSIPAGVTRIGGGAFQGCHSLTSITLPETIVEIGSYAFDECYNLSSIQLPKRMEYISAYAFSDTALEEVVVPSGIEFLGNFLFFNCRKLRTVSLQEGLKNIGNSSFAGCSALEEIEIPGTVEMIRKDAFKQCRNLKNLTFNGVLEIIELSAFSGCTGITYVEAPFSSDMFIELYDEKREIFKNNPLKLSELPVDYIRIGDVFPDIDTILWESTSTEELAQPLPTKEINFLQQARSFIMEGDFELALAQLTLFISLHPHDHDAHLLLGQLHYLKGDYIPSIEAYNEAATTKITDGLLLHLGHALLDESFKDPSVGRYKEQVLDYMPTCAYDMICMQVAEKSLYMKP